MPTKRLWASLDPFLESGPMLGRIQANAGFLKGLLSLDPYDAYRFYPPSTASCQDLAQKIMDLRPDFLDSGRIQVINRSELPRRLAETDHHVFHLSDCIVAPGFLAAARNAYSRKIFPVTAVTHSLSYARYGQDFLKHLSPCTTPRDAVVATSRTAVGVVQAYYRYLRDGYGLAEGLFPEPSVEHIPLGVDLDVCPPPDEENRKALRAAFGFGQETVFLVLARLCHSSKMDFLPILRAFHRASRDGFQLGTVRLVLAGWTDEEDWGLQTLTDLAGNIGLPLSVVSRPSDARKWELYAASDVFLSPSDNLQETFGLTLLEAQAMGLPVIASDFDGYRDLVIPEETGVLVPTVGPSATDAIDIMAPMSFDNHIHLALAQRMAVDVPALAAALVRFAGDAALRLAMGEAARRNAGRYSWREIARQHVDLWERLWTREVPNRLAQRHPSAVPYAQVFAGYPTASLDSSTNLVVSRFGSAVYRGQDFPLVYAGLEEIVDMDTVRSLLVLARKPRDADNLCVRLRGAVSGLSIENAQALILWCLKHDLLERVDG
ncbi:MAG: glycosyltransferase family 4 protein [Desulfovibrio sp.]|nr:glycosyltransferase family 4 protein [Desulfovibrio sp.]MBI4958722.1 glycosyltransferase family 4 protein [Desulfovibrio sp.]